ncbi:MAG: ADP-ribosylglycohydrolase family protein [Ramlibacter sp.]|nr:ADP-ribosylglycohydrolase family protein [Cryobacterium sp.]
MIRLTDAAGRPGRALGAFYGLALGDALGMPTQSMSREAILADYGAITGFRDAGPRQLIAAGMPAGRVTDDTEQAVLLARILVEGDGRFDPRTFADRLIEWEAAMRARGSLDLLGPSTSAAVRRLVAGESARESGRFGTTNGAAMRIAPVGIAFRLSSLTGFVDRVARASEVTHNTTLGIGSAAAVGAAVSAGVAGASLAETVRSAIDAAAEGERRGHWRAGGSIAARLRWATGHLAGLTPAAQAGAAYELIGTSVAAQESVVAALALAAVAQDPWETLCLAAGLGGDTDTIAAIVGAVLGSVFGLQGWPAEQVATLRSVNGLDLDDLVHGLLAVRDADEPGTDAGSPPDSPAGTTEPR